jgi:glycosyltransferase involved in cell wall biosynthesis
MHTSEQHMNNADKKVSVIVPTYNREKFLGYAIDSVLNQTHRNLELHIIDDGSTDRSRELISAYKDDRVSYYYQMNSGQSVARNVGIKDACGDYLCFLDSDNVWKLDKLEKQLRLMEVNPDFQILYGENEVIDEDGRVLPSGASVRRYSGNIMQQLMVFNFVNFNTAMIKMECFKELGGMNENTRVGDDYELFLKFSSRYKFLYVPEIFAQYRVMENQISSNKDKRFQSNFNILSNFMVANSKLLDKRTINYTWCRFYTTRGRYLASTGRLGQAFRDYQLAIRYKPLSKHPWRALAKLLLLRR